MNDEVKKIAGTFFWANFYERNSMSGKYQFEFGNLSDDAVKWLESKDISVQNKGDERGYYITYKSDKYPIKAEDADRQEMSQEIRVGNGSKGVVVTGRYEWKFKNKKGFSPTAKKVIVTHLKEYKPEEKAPSGDDEEVL